MRFGFGAIVTERSVQASTWVLGGSRTQRREAVRAGTPESDRCGLMGCPPYASPMPQQGPGGHRGSIAGAHPNVDGVVRERPGRARAFSEWGWKAVEPCNVSRVDIRGQIDAALAPLGQTWPARASVAGATAARDDAIDIRGRDHAIDTRAGVPRRPYANSAEPRGKQRGTIHAHPEECRLGRHRARTHERLQPQPGRARKAGPKDVLVIGYQPAIVNGGADDPAPSDPRQCQFRARVRWHFGNRDGLQCGAAAIPVA